MNKFFLALALIVAGILPAIAQGYYPTSVKPSGTLPILYINVYEADGINYDNEIIDINLSHKNYFAGEYWLDINDCEWMEDLGFKSVGSEEEPLPLQIKARGNYTRTHFCKKPFKIKLDKKQNLLGLTPDKSKHYALLAHADDSHGFLRNFTGFAIGKRMELPWTPSQQPIELVINGDYRGLYFLTESIRVGDGRIMIEELEDNETNPALVSGGYVVELDNHPDDNCIKFMEKSCVRGDKPEEMAVTFDTPEEYSDIQKKFVTEQMTTINNLIGGKSDDLWSYLDMDDAARYYLVMEIISHREAYRGSTYLSRDRGEGQKWHFNAVWDCGHGFDAGKGNFFYNDYMFHNVWIASICQNERFMDKVKETWKWFMSSKFDGVYEEMDEYIDNISRAAVKDWERWSKVPRPNYPDSRDLQNNSNTGWKLSEVQDQMKSKIKWLATQFGNYNGKYDEPERDTTPAAPLPSYVQSGIFEIEATTEDAVYFNLQGIKVAEPTPGQIYIEMTPGKESRKIMMR